MGKLEARLGDAADRWRGVRRKLQLASTLDVKDYPLENGLLGVCSAACGLAGPSRPLNSLQVDGVVGVSRYSRNPGPVGVPPFISERVIPVDKRRGVGLFPRLGDGLIGVGTFDMGALRGTLEGCAEIEKITGAGAHRRGAQLVAVPSNCSEWKAAAAERTATHDGAVRDEMGVFAMFCSHDFFILGQIMHSAERYSYAIADLLIVVAIHKCIVRTRAAAPPPVAMQCTSRGPTSPL